MNKILKNKKIIIHMLIIASIILSAVISLQTGFAATTNINNTTSGGISGALSISSSGDIIELDEGIYKGNNNTNITINKNITIQGKTKDKVILDAQGLSRIFRVNSNQNITFINITFINGRNSLGGAIYGGPSSNALILTFVDCAFTNNSATNTTAIDGNGGVICTDTNSTIILIGCEFNNNSATKDGGVIYTYYGNVDIFDSNFINNTANRGGAIFILGGNTTVIESNFSYNTATDSAGALAVLYNKAIIIDSNFTNNTATSRGGAVILSGSSRSIIKDSNFINNTAGSTGGVLYIGTSHHVIVSSSNFINNNAGAGGAIFNDCGDNFTVNNSNFTENKATIGGAIYQNYGNDMNVFDSIFTNNIANNSIIFISEGSNGTITGSNVSNNAGNGIIINGGNFTITDNVINDNDGDGIINKGNVTVENNNVSGNFGGDIVNAGDINGLGSVNNIQLDLAINISVLYNKVTIMVKATDKWGNVIVGRLISFYVNGKLVGSSITNSEGIAEFVYTASASGTYNILSTMNESDESDTFITRIYSANTSTIAKVVLEKDTVITVSAPTINEGKKTNIKVTLKDINGNILKGKKVSLKINGKTYTATTNNKGIAVFKIVGLKGGKYNLIAKFGGDNNYKSSTTKVVQKVNAKSNLGIVSIKELSVNKRLSTCKVIIANKGSLKSKSTVLALFHMRNGVKIKTKYIKIKSIAPGKKISIIVSYFPDRANHRYCIAHFQIDPKNKNKEILLANNKKSISLKH
ncbi:Ig-like domain-containing protein [Methanobrevibacter sp. TMH8]|uniref:Ig-like domain repeat protein n=1 Tax=Methanobrevibacter sp. TMH8 TaxID=2848611 RepID=UPI001CCA47E6|nr:Ig-like domain-containing protein [Methanobrevibacter sp. TMH8]